MRAIVTAILTGVLICIGTLVSVAKVANLQHEEDRDTVLNAQLLSLKSNVQTQQSNEKITNTYWQLNKLTDAMNILRDQWKAVAADWKPANHAEFCKVAARLEGVYIDRGNFDHALQVQSTLLQYDKKLYGEKSPEVARDFNNEALCLYLKGTTVTTPKERRLYFISAIKAIEDSNSIWEGLNTDRSAFNIAINKKLEQLARRDLASAKTN